MDVSRRDLLRLLGIAGGSAALSQVLAACATPATPAAPSAPAAAKLADKLTFAIPLFGASCDPHLLIGGQWTEVMAVVYETPVTMTDDKLTPALAESWKTTDNNVTWEFKLRPNVKFSNGEPCDAAAWEFSFNRGAKGATPMPGFARLAPAIESVTAIDATTVKVISKVPDALIPRRMLDLRIVPPKYVQSISAEEFGRKPVGTGPYQVTDWQPNTSVTLQAWPEAWRGAARTKELQFLMVPEPSARLNAVRTGTADLAAEIAFDAAKSVQSNPDMKLIATDESAIVSLFMVPLQDSPLKDVKVRQAVRHAINKKVLIESLFGGLQKAAGAQFVPAAVYGYDANLKDLEFDLTKAKQLMAEAGFPNGFDIKLSTNAGINFVSDVTQLLADQVRQIGIRTEIEILEAGVYNQRFFANQLGPFQVIFSSTTPQLDADVTLGFWTSTSVPSRMKVEEFDQTLIRSRAEPDPAKRLALLQRCIQIIHEQSVVAPLYQTANLWVMGKNVDGFKKSLGPGINIPGIVKSI